jgi:Fic family protein
MAIAPERLASSLRQLKAFQERSQRVFAGTALSRVHRQRLLKAGYLAEVIKGWYIVSRPGDRPGDSTAWHAAFYDFVGAYCTSRFGEDWYLSPDQSLLRYAGNTVVPRQLIVHAKAGTNNRLELPFQTSLLDYQARDFATGESVLRDGLRLLALPVALARATAHFFQRNPLEAGIALSLLRDVSDLAAPLLAADRAAAAGRLVGALRAIGRVDDADQLLSTMRVTHTVHEVNPFEGFTPTGMLEHQQSPYRPRIRLMWETMRLPVIAAFPAAPGLPADPEAYMREVADRHVEDAYNSLSIEGYQVTEQLIARIASGNWTPDHNAQAITDRDALAAHGYHLAFLSVRASVDRVLGGENAGTVARRDHRDWYRLLFEPAARAGLLTPSDLAGYRSSPVFIRNSRHVPPSPDAIRDTMPVLFDLLAAEPEASVRAVLGHFILVYLHPYSDGNGRIGRFLLNVMLASGGYPWTVIPVTRRAEYLAGLEAASVGGDIGPFTAFVASCMPSGID